MSLYYRPLAQTALPRPRDAKPLAGGWCWFTHAVRHDRQGGTEIIAASEIPAETLDRLTRPRTSIASMTMDAPRLMGILNVTPDSFSDGGTHYTASTALRHAREMVVAGADIIDVGGESTRPGALPVPFEAEIARVEPAITAIASSLSIPVSIDTRKSCVADVAVKAGAQLVNDVSGFTHDPMLARYCIHAGLPVCVMHAQGDPETMQDNPRYDDVLLDVFDFLSAQVTMLEEAGIPRDRIVVDPGIGFGKTIAHNLTILNGLSIFHGIGCPVLLGASRKGFIGRISAANPAGKRAHGSVAVALAGVAQGVQILRIHDVAETAQALSLWQAVTRGEWDGA